MEPQIRPLFLFIATFLFLNYPHSASSQDFPAGAVTFLQEPEDTYFIVKKKPAKITCQARYAAEISFTCGGTKIPPTSVEVEDMTETDPDLTQAAIMVTRTDVNNYRSEDGSPYWCECTALNVDEQPLATSRRAEIKVAYLKHDFRIQPISTQATEGQDIELLCEAPEGEPRPSILWRKNKKRVPIKSNNRYSMTNRGTLVIKSVEIGDAGKYQCVTKNMAGRRESKEAMIEVSALGEVAEAEESVSKERKPRESDEAKFIVSPKEEIYIMEEDTFTIDCTVRYAEIITFRCNGVRMDRKRQDISKQQDEDGSSILVSKLNLSYKDVKDYMDKGREGDDRTYQCQCVAWYQDDQSERGWSYISSDETVGKVIVKFLDDKFQKEPTDVTVGLGFDAMLTCQPPDGKPTPWVHWYKDNKKLDPRIDNRYQIHSKGSLTIKRAQYNDMGRYSCVAENGIRQVQSRMARLIVTAEPPPTTTPVPTKKPEKVLEFPAVIPDEPTWTQNLEAENEIGDDGIATLTCTVVSADQLSIDCNERRLREREYKLSRKRDRKSRKQLLSITTDIGAGDVAQNPDNYFCVCTAWYRIEGKWEKLPSNKGFIREIIRAYIEDDFVYPPSSVEAYFEEEAEFACEPPMGNPRPKVYWMKDGQRIDTERDTNFVVLSEGSLILEYVRLQDEGTYQCVAENEAGTKMSDSVTLTVLGKPTSPTPEPEYTHDITSPEIDIISSTEYYDVLNEPFFTNEPEAKNYIFSDESITLKCSVVNANNLLFACNNETLKESENTAKSITDPISGMLVIENFLTITAEQVEEFNHQDPYTCTCQGYFIPQGETEWVYLESRVATIQKAFLRRRFKQMPEDTTGQLGSDVEIVCRPPEGVPKPKVQWIKDGYQISESQKYMVTEEGSLIIKQLEDSDAGDYTCSAENVFRKRTSGSIALKVVAGPVTDGEVPEPVSETTPGDGETTYPEPEPEPSTPEPESTTQIIPTGTRFISKDLHSVYYLVKNRPVSILCEAHDVTVITFTCGGQEISDTMSRGTIFEQFSESGEVEYVSVIEANITITKQDVENYYDEYYCVCRAHYTLAPDAPSDEKGYIESSRGYVEIAYLKKNFIQEPESQTVYEGDFLSISCQPPQGNPAPSISWLKDGESVESNSFGQGAFIVEAASVADIGEYACVAENEVARRISESVKVEVLQVDTITDVGGSVDIDGGMDTKPTDGSMTTDDTDTDDSTIEVEVITKVPLTTEAINEESTTSTMDKVSDSPDSTSEPQGSPEPTPEDNLFSYLPTEQSGSSSQESSTTEDMSDTEDITTPSEQDEKTTTDVFEESTGDNTYPYPHMTDMDSTPYPDTLESTRYPVIKEDSTYSVIDHESATQTDENIESNTEYIYTTVPPTYHEQTSDQHDVHIYPDFEEGTMSTDGPYPEPDSSTKGEDMITHPRITMVDERKICMETVSECTSLMPGDSDIFAKCSALPDYLSCIDNFIDGCTGVINDASIEAAVESTNKIRMSCEMLDKCPRLGECKTVYDNMDTMNNGALPVHTFCSDIGSFMQCADQTLAECDVSMVSPNRNNGHNSLTGIEQWFADYCERFVMGTPSLSSCEIMTECRLPIAMAAENNSTYWCRLVDSLITCTEDSVMQCQMDELVQNLDILKMRADDACLHGDDMIGHTGMDDTGMDKPEPTPEDHDTAEPIKPANQGGDTGATRDENGDDGAISVMASLLLITLTQFIVTAILSHR